uniref:Methyltransferase FkbM domain-containing protein n=1 Tax=Ascaris suum TaxID=6253 RepID=F1LB01_ASCSU
MVRFGILRLAFLFICLLFCICVIYFHRRIHDGNASSSSSEVHTHNVILYKKCIYNRFTKMPAEKYWLLFSQTVTSCLNMFIDPNRFSLIRLPNRDEVKYVRLPTRNIKAGDSCNIVTLGIGHDIYAEKKLQTLFPPICSFYGADPAVKVNKELYESFGGRFFPLAVGAVSRNDTALVMGYEGGVFYKEHSVQHVDIVRFLRHYAGIQSPIDVIIMDIEGREFGILPLLEQGSLLDDNNITVCQWNIEFHWPNPEQNESFRRFIINTIRDERYLMLKAIFFPLLNLNRIFLINIADPFCLERYITKIDV